MKERIKIAFLVLLVFTVITGLVYPICMTALAQLLFPRKANGSLVLFKGKEVGSELIGQHFDDPKFFWGRPSATEPFPNNAISSSASNLGPNSPKLRETVEVRITVLRQSDPGNDMPIPIDLVTASGSGLDPHISLKAALYQMRRIAKIRKLSEEQLSILIQQNTETRQFGFLGEPRVNVLKLNLALELFNPKEGK